MKDKRAFFLVTGIGLLLLLIAGTIYYRGAEMMTDTLESAPSPTDAGPNPTPTKREQEDPESKKSKDGCAIGGCNGELCLEESETKELFSICVYKPEYSCYKSTVCEPQANGRCGWTQTPQLTACLQDFR